MTCEWPTLTVEECASPEKYATQIGPFGDKIRAETYVPAGLPVLRGVNCASERSRFHDDDFVFVPVETRQEYAPFIAKAGDVVLVHKGTLGKAGLIPHDSKFPEYVLGNSMMRVRCDEQKLLPEFLFYWLSSPRGLAHIEGRVSQVGVPQIQRPLSTLREIAFPIPPVDEQREIVRILRAVDERIELKVHLNRTLEKILHATYRAVFLNFELDVVFPNLVPRSSATESGRTLPLGWTTGIVGDIASNVRENVKPGTIGAETHYIALEHMPRRSVTLDVWSSAEGVASSKSKFQPRDILFGKLRPYFHKVGIAPIAGVCATDILVLRPRGPEWGGLLLGIVSSPEFIEYTTARSTGTKMPRTNWRDMAAFEIPIPPPNILKAYQSHVGPLLEAIIANAREIARLRDLRGLILPRLVSGATRVELKEGDE